jgi:Rieske Fe-S protein
MSADSGTSLYYSPKNPNKTIGLNQFIPDAKNYPFAETEYTAVWMRCSHQGAELQASGDQLQCSAHGSEFSNKGKVTNGPADTDLRTFPVTVSNNELFIDLRKV